MNKAQIAVLAVAIAAGGGAFMMMSSSSPPPANNVAAPVVAPPPIAIDEVLVATRDLTYGTAIGDPDIAWMEWPKGSAPKGVILKSENPTAKEEIKGSYVRVQIANGEPVRRERLIKGPTAGLMSTLLPSGKRAVSIEVPTLNTLAGGFILPNDRVDVIRTYRDQEQTKDRGVEVMNSEIILSNVRVLAIGETLETKNGESVVKGVTATLELDPRQAEYIVLAQRTGQLALALRPLVDSNPKDDANIVAPSGTDDGALTIVRYGVSTSQHTK